MTHWCLNDAESDAPTYWLKDAHGIPLCRACERCEVSKLGRYRPEILSGYTQDDVNEPIEEDA